MIDEAIRRCLRYAIGTCVGLSALLYILDPATLASLPRPGVVPGGGSATGPGPASREPPAPPPPSRPAPRQPLQVRAPTGVVLVAFAPATLGDALRAAAGEFRQQHGGSGVLLNLGTTAQHRQVLAAGRYADLVIGAGADALAPLAAAGRVRAPRPLGAIPLALAVPPTNPGKVASLADLATPGRKLAIAVPSTQPGALTREALERAPPEVAKGILANVVTQVEEPSELLTRLGLGDVDAAFLMRTQLSGQVGMQLKEVALPDPLRPRVPFEGAVSPTSDRLPYAEAFLAFLGSSAGRRLLAGYGIEPPPSS